MTHDANFLAEANYIIGWLTAALADEIGDELAREQVDEARSFYSRVRAEQPFIGRTTPHA